MVRGIRHDLLIVRYSLLRSTWHSLLASGKIPLIHRKLRR